MLVCYTPGERGSVIDAGIIKVKDVKGLNVVPVIGQLVVVDKQGSQSPSGLAGAEQSN